MDEKERELALEDLRVIKRMLAATNKVVANNGLNFILFGAYWVVTGSMMVLIEKIKHLTDPKILYMIFIFWVLAATIFMVLYNRSHPQNQTDWSKVSPRIKNQIKEGVSVLIAVGLIAPLLAQRVAPNDIIIFTQSLIMGLGFYFVGMFLTSEFRITGLFLLLGTFLFAFGKGKINGFVIFTLSFGIGSILTGIFSRYKWLKMKKE